MILLNIYMWISALGFPILLSHWLVYERKMSNRDYRTGHDDGWIEGWESYEDWVEKHYDIKIKEVK